MIERADINSVLQQMRSLQAQAQRSQDVTAPAITQEVNIAKAVGQAADDSSFKDLLMNAVNGINDLQSTAKNLATAYEKGDRTVDLPQVMIAAEKASVSFQAMTQVRNKLVSAYEDIMRMSI